MTSRKVVESPKTETPKQSGGQLESQILSVIENESHRPGAIANALHKKYDQNTVLKALLGLEKKGMVERDSSKAWIAKGKGGGKGKEKEKGKDKEKVKEKEKEKEKEKDKSQE